MNRNKFLIRFFFNALSQLSHQTGKVNILLTAMRARQCSRQEVLSHFSNTIIDDKMRRHMALDWLSREQDSPGVIKRELRSCYNEIYRERREGKELRFLFEKRNILLIAQEQLEGKQN